MLAIPGPSSSVKSSLGEVAAAFPLGPILLLIAFPFVNKHPLGNSAGNTDEVTHRSVSDFV